jgi:ABC-type bacteriocin/lantibiotic exporter with double-glycine peptidase domain
MVGIEVEHALADVEAVLGQWSKARDKYYGVHFRQFIGIAVIQVLASTLLLAIGGWLIYAGELTVGQLVAGELMMTAALAGVGQLGKLLPKFYEVLAATGKAGEVLDLQRHRELGATLPAGPLSVLIGDGAEAVVVPAGARVRVEAPSDAWDAIIAALGGLSPVAVRLGGAGPGSVSVPAGSCSREALAARVMALDALVFIPATVAANLRMSAPELSDDQVWRLLEAVGLARRGVRADTEVGVDGSGLDRLGRAQLTVARALAGRPGLIVIDGLLDRLSGDERAALMALLTAPDADWTVLVRSADRALAAHTTHALRCLQDASPWSSWSVDVASGEPVSASPTTAPGARTAGRPGGGAP